MFWTCWSSASLLIILIIADAGVLSFLVPRRKLLELVSSLLAGLFVPVGFALAEEGVAQVARIVSERAVDLEDMPQYTPGKPPINVELTYMSCTLHLGLLTRTHQ